MILKEIIKNQQAKDDNKLDIIKDITMGESLCLINVLMSQTSDIWYQDNSKDNYKETMNMIRKISGVCVKLGEKYGMLER